MIEQKYLDEFAYFGDLAYMDIGSLGMQPERTRRFCRQFQDKFVESLGRICLGPYGLMRDEVRQKLAQLLHCSSNEIFFVKNTSEGNALLAKSLKLQPGDQVLTSNDEFESLLFPWIQKQREGVVLKYIKSENGVIDEDKVIEALNPKVKVVAFSYVQQRSGYKLDVKKIGDACKERGILFMLDGIQGIGRNDLDVKDANVDLLSCGGFKGLLGVLGAGFVYCNSKTAQLIEPNTYDSENMLLEEDYPKEHDYTAPAAYRPENPFEAGSPNTYGICAMGESVGLLNEIGIETIEKQIREVEIYYRNCLEKANLPVQIRGSKDPKHFSGNISITYDDKYDSRLQEMLDKYHICIYLRKGDLRVGLHYYNNCTQIDRLMAALKETFSQQ